MDFAIDFYETREGLCPVLKFLEELRKTDPGDHAVVLRGMVKLRNRQYPESPCAKP